MNEQVAFETIATWDFVLKPKGKKRIPITVYLGRPFEKDGIGECPFQIVPLMVESKSVAHIDALSALKGTISMIGHMICFYCVKYEAKLTKSDMRKLFFLFPEAFEAGYPEEVARMRQEDAEEEQRERKRKGTSHVSCLLARSKDNATLSSAEEVAENHSSNKEK